jgi:hypothetical protein
MASRSTRPTNFSNNTMNADNQNDLNRDSGTSHTGANQRLVTDPKNTDANADPYKNDVNDAGGNLDKGQAQDDINGGGEEHQLGRQGGGAGERSGLGQTPPASNKQPSFPKESDPDSKPDGMQRGGQGGDHSGKKGNHQGDDGRGGGKSSGSAGHGGDPNATGKEKDNDKGGASGGPGGGGGNTGF